MTPLNTALFVLIAPLASAALIMLFLGRRGAAASAVSVVTAALVACGALSLAFGGGRFTAAWEWLRFGSFAISIGFKFDDLAALMLSVVGVIGLCVHVYSLGYMSDDAGKARYFGGLSIFMFSMIGIVLADNLFMMFIFWDLVGFSSYFLINHWRERKSASDAAKKAFIVNRVGDFGFLLGIILCYRANGTVNLSALGADHAVYSRLIPLLLFCGAVGKSAQLPLQVWLPDAMEGPTPVSALIHAATMVAAGIYMLCRINVLMVPEAQSIITWVGTLTALYAALCAVTQRDIKKVLAYSTLSQLGYMVAAFGMGSVGAAMFHLTTHAFFKALLFLGAGGFAAQEALAAVNRASLGWFEGNRGLTAALRALRGGFGFGKTGSRRTGALGLAGLATLGLVLEVLVVEEVLFSRCENEIRVAIHAFEHAVLKLRHRAEEDKHE